LFIELSILPPIEVNENMLLYHIMFCRNDLFLWSSPFNKPSRRLGGLFNSGIWTFPFWQHNENSTSFKVLHFSALSSYQSWALQYWHSKKGSPILSSSEHHYKTLAWKCVYFNLQLYTIVLEIMYLVTLLCNTIRL